MDYKKYSLEQLENWLHDAITAGEASAQEIYETIKKVVEEEHTIYKNHASKCYDLLSFLNGNGNHLNFTDFTNHSSSSSYAGDTIVFGNPTQDSVNNFWEEHYYPEEVKDYGMSYWGHSDLEYGLANSTLTEDRISNFPGEQSKVKKWVLPVEVDGPSGEYYVTFPEDMLDQLGWEEGDTLEYNDNKDGSFTIKKENKVGTI